MFDRIVVICDGNICRSPTAAAMLANGLAGQGKQVSSAGLIAVVGHDMDDTARQVAEACGLICPQHEARQLDARAASEAELMLVMEKRQRNEVIRRFPVASGKVFLLSHWSGGDDIPDPYRRDRETFEYVYKLLERGSQDWLARIK